MCVCAQAEVLINCLCTDVIIICGKIFRGLANSQYSRVQQVDTASHMRLKVNGPSV